MDSSDTPVRLSLRRLSSLLAGFRCIGGFFFVVPLLLLVLGCDKSSRMDVSPSAAVFAPVEAQIKALNRRDAATALSVMHPEAPGLAGARQATEQVTAAFDLVYIIQGLTVESLDKNEAKVRFTQLTQKVSGPEFRNNRVTGVHTLRKDHGAWKIYSTQALKIEYLDP